MLLYAWPKGWQLGHACCHLVGIASSGHYRCLINNNFDLAPFGKAVISNTRFESLTGRLEAGPSEGTHKRIRGGNEMNAAALTKTGTILQGLQTAGRSIRRGVVATCAAIALVVLYGLGSLGTQIVSAVGITGLTLATTATPADAQRRRGRRGGRRGGRRRGRRRSRRRRGNRWEWYYIPYWW